ncbi:MAG: hypothetical protein KA436_03660 [Oligoflexales bacterium]|nr:hypothetical protein [Oligoflexales bacterium]
MFYKRCPHIPLLFGIFLWVCSSLCLAKTNEPIYQDPFDLAAGGSSLTWATQEGILVSNPALLPYGGKFFRWVGLKTSLFPGKESLNLTRSLLKNKGVKKDSTKTTEEQNNELIDTLFNTPIHLGASVALSFITSRGGLAVFSSLEPDLKAWKNGDPTSGSGLPALTVRNEFYTGAYASLATRSPFENLSFGLSLKSLYVADQVLHIDLLDTDSINKAGTDLSKPSSKLPHGLGVDLGTLLFLQGKHTDLRLAASTVNVGGLQLSNSDQDPIPQTLNVGLGLTFHSDTDALHLSIDFRDTDNKYKEALFKRIYAGVRLMLRQYVGLAAGVYHGTPTVGAELDLIFMRVAASAYTREYGDNPGVDPRRIYAVSLTWGVDF